jgi:hypothetical protein
MSRSHPPARVGAEPGPPKAAAPDPTERARVVVTVHMGRCGSTVLGNLLGQHPGVAWAGEVFNPRLKIWRRGADPIETIEAHRRSLGKSIYGLELKTWDSRHSGLPLRDMLQRLDDRYAIHRVLLWRRNFLRAIVSFLAALAFGYWQLRAGTTPRLIPVRIDLARLVYRGVAGSLIEHLERHEQEIFYARSLLAEQPHLELIYEDDLEPQPLLGYAKVAAFVGLSDFTPVPSLARMNPFPLEAIVENFAEVRAALEGTHFAWMLR